MSVKDNGGVIKTHIPPVKPRSRDREFKQFSEIARDEVVYKYLFDGLSHRELDENVLGQSPEYSRGYLSMGILHYLGLEDVHKGIFSAVSPAESIVQLERAGQDYQPIVACIQRHIDAHVPLTERIPSNISTHHIISALHEIENVGIDNVNPPTKFEVLFDGKRYPPKEVLRFANDIANGEELIDFGGGDQTNNFLIHRGFKIVLKGTDIPIELNYTRNLKPKVNGIEMNDDEINDIQSSVPTETEREQLVKARVGQSTFKKGLLQKECKCKFCGVTDERFLVASHIKPWSKSDNMERLDVNNGFLLCPHHDFLFDKGFVSFDVDGRIVIAPTLGEKTKLLMNVHENLRIETSDEQQQYLQWHREWRFQGKK